MRYRTAGMLAVVALLSGGEAWAQQDDATIKKGQEVFRHWCGSCHDEGSGQPGTAALAVKYKGTSTPALLEARTDLTRASLRFFVRSGVSIMPPFRKTEVSDADFDALAAYLAQASRTRGGNPR